MEEGEEIDRGIGYWNSEAGVSAKFLWGLIRPPKQPAAPPSGEDKPPPPIDLKKLYGKFIYGRGAVAPSSRLGDVLTLARPAAGIGFGVELRGLAQRANLTIGWAKSRQSWAHRKRGLLILGVDFDF
jgi:hypothetical protein